MGLQIVQGNELQVHAGRFSPQVITQGYRPSMPGKTQPCRQESLPRIASAVVGRYLTPTWTTGSQGSVIHGPH